LCDRKAGAKKHTSRPAGANRKKPHNFFQQPPLTTSKTEIPNPGHEPLFDRVRGRALDKLPYLRANFRPTTNPKTEMPKSIEVLTGSGTGGAGTADTVLATSTSAVNRPKQVHTFFMCLYLSLSIDTLTPIRLANS
jgi:hypothetical protein